MIRDVRLADIMSVEAPKMRRSQRTTGSQEVRKYFERRTGSWNQLACTEGKPIVFGFANFVRIWQ
jgi:hypothetical protein